jgi:nucleoid-associated protein YgaU
MKPARLALCAFVAATMLAACEEKIDVPGTGSADAAAAQAPAANAPAPAPAQPVDAAPIQPVAVAADAVQVGTALDASGAATGAKPAYAAADTLYASLPTKGRAGTAKVYWTGANGLSVKEEEKAMSGAYVNFQFSRADGMTPGKYNVEIDVDGVPAGIVDVTVQ